MKSLLSRKFSLAFTSALVCASPLLLTSCGSSNTIQFANFESYMDDDLMSYLTDKYDVEYQWFTVDEMIETKFENVYDIAVPSGYELVSLYKRGWLEKLDWSKFNIPGVANKDDAKQLFETDGINQMNEIFRVYLNDNTFDVLDYGVPYFSQSFTFVYKGSELTFYKNGTEETTDKPTWQDIFFTISPANRHLDKRFNQTVTGRTGMLDDAKSLYDVSRIMETTDPTNPFIATNTMPEGAKIPDLVNTYKTLTDKFADKTGSWFALNTDSGIISRNLADHTYGYEAALTWSGDALYGAMGAEEFDEYTGEELHIQKPYGTSLDEIEFLVVNKKNKNNQAKIDRIYKILFDVCLDAYDATPETLLDQENNHYKYWAMQNWDRVMYMPMLKSIYNCVTDPSFDYWTYVDEEQKVERPESSKQLFTHILSATNPEWASSVFGRTLTPLENSNTHWAWLQSRGKL